MKTQHRYSNIREHAYSTLASLILEDYLKFRGTLLVYILAGLLDQQREIKELAVELIMKYTLEKSDIFLRSCLVECPFVFNACPCFGVDNTGLARSGSILKGPTKKAAREYIYQYLIRKIEAVYLYMYFGNILRLHEFIQKDPSIAKSSDYQSAIADFLFICSEICIVNEKQKKNLEKIVKESHNGEGIEMNDDDEIVANERNTDETEKKGRGGKKNQPTLKQSLAAVEKIVPLVSSIDNSLRSYNQELFAPVLDRFCTNMCIHFESLLEYAQPREFWAPFIANAKKSTAAAPSRQSKKHSAKTVKVVEPPPPPEASTSRSETPKPSKRKENDSGHFTLEDDDDDFSSKVSASANSRRSASRASKRTSSQVSEMSVARTPRRNSKRINSSHSQEPESDNESVFSELSDFTTISQKRKNTLPKPSPSNKKSKLDKQPPTPKTPASRRSKRWTKTIKKMTTTTKIVSQIENKTTSQIHSPYNKPFFLDQCVHKIQDRQYRQDIHQRVQIKTKIIEKKNTKHDSIQCPRRTN